MIIIRRRSFSPIRTAAELAENTSARDPVKKESERGRRKKKKEKEKPRRECAMMCWKKAHTSADMQSLGKHVEGMIHLKLPRP